MSKIRISSLLIGALLSAAAHSATVYVSDIQFVAIREGQDNNTRAVERGLKSGTPLELLEQQGGYTKVRTPSGNEGWVADYFLSDDMVSRDQLSTLQDRLTQSTNDKAEMADALIDAENTIQQLSELNSAMQDENSQLKKSITDTAELTEKAQRIVAQNRDVSYQIESLKQQTANALAQAESLKSSTAQKWYMLGVATLLGGLILGISLPMMRRKKNNTGSWS
ncbi:TIGR04211 family SH3 domain-containing protein [Marinomonas sp. A79]|uniref:TIGR04211 family SH3 domain-containing protein n=1 Tax=Marinomonas vulgaris TaxID=2823372 RepID=A0ABS5H9A5_9GAMM|nr:TIGR04211 family SH3 domain-containing protein [Marinomonas vulgaris]MBR7888022.1 TIGR04211 family SH3 domain-containing protein [Marinomonas vulgaris]